jgi:elongation factor P
MISTSDFKKGLKILVDGEPYTIIDFQHVKPGKGNQFTRTKLKSLLTPSNLERTIKSGEKFEVPDVEYRDMNFLYRDDTGFNFMDQTSYEQMALNDGVVGDGVNYLTENLEVKVCLYNGRAVGIELPNTVNLKVVETAPGHKGNTVTGGTKPAKLETGHTVMVPLHIAEGDLLKVSTVDGSYSERVNLK